MSKKKKEKNVSDEFVYDQFVQFLHSPVWQLPVVSFIEQRSIIFDKDNRNDQLFKEEHEQFRRMVDFLIECFCDDLGITPSRVSTALSAAKNSEKRKEKMEVFEPVIAVQDYELFVQMMMRKNIELQLQALQMIEFMCGVLPAVLKAAEDAQQQSSAHANGNEQQQEHVILLQVMQKSKEDYEKQTKNESEMQKELEAAVKESAEEKKRLEHLRNTQLELERRTLALSIEDTTSSNSQAAAEPEAPPASVASTSSRDSVKSAKKDGSIKKRPSSKQGRKTSDSAAPAKKETAAAAAPVVDPTAIAQRQQYMRQQRDKLLQMKQEARQKAFMEAESTEATARPKTANAARSALRGQSARSQRMNAEVLQARRALADKLKAELL